MIVLRVLTRFSGQCVETECRSLRLTRRTEWGLVFHSRMLKFSVQTPDLGKLRIASFDILGISSISDSTPLSPRDPALHPTDELRLTFKAPERAATIEPEGWKDSASYMCLVCRFRLVD